MAMLAEARRKQKWSVDPRNSTWSKDESKFGQKMLEKMGWSKGKGLGKAEQGATEHIKVQVKNNSLGLGTNASHEDDWISHQDDYNQLLAELNSFHSHSESPSEQKQKFSLEEKSKTSRKRVHYMKFTKGKDLSNRSQSDMACIFGRRSKQEEDKSQENSEEEEDMAKEENGVTPELDEEVASRTVTSSLTMQEYFAQRMAQMRSNQGEKLSSAACEEAAEQCRTKAKKDKKKRREVAEVKDESEEQELELNDRKKRKRVDQEVVDEVPQEPAEEPGSAEQAGTKKKKKNKKCDEREDEDGEEAAMGKKTRMEKEPMQELVVKKSRKHKKKM